MGWRLRIHGIAVGVLISTRVSDTHLTHTIHHTSTVSGLTTQAVVELRKSLGVRHLSDTHLTPKILDRSGCAVAGDERFDSSLIRFGELYAGSIAGRSTERRSLEFCPHDLAAAADRLWRRG